MPSLGFKINGEYKNRIKAKSDLEFESESIRKFLTLSSTYS